MNTLPTLRLLATQEVPAGYHCTVEPEGSPNWKRNHPGHLKTQSCVDSAVHESNAKSNEIITALVYAIVLIGFMVWVAEYWDSIVSKKELKGHGDGTRVNRRGGTST